MKKPTLSDFAAKTIAAERPAPAERTRGKNSRVAVAIRLEQEDWVILHDYAIRQGLSLQKLALQAIAEKMTRDGVKPISGK